MVLRAAALGCLAALVSSALAAAEAEDGEERPRLRLPTARVSALEMDELPESPTSFATVIEASDFAGESETTADVLGQSVGVQVRRYGGPGQFSELSIRGASGQQVVILLDGIRLNSAQSGTVDLSTIPFELVERIEVRRGGGSVQVGSDAIGGVVNIVTRQPSSEPETTAKFAGGSFDSWEGSLSHSQRVGPLDLLGAYAGFASEGDFAFQSISAASEDGTPVFESRELTRINNQSQSHSVLLRAAGDPTDTLRLTATNDFIYQSRGQPGSDLGQGENGGQRAQAHERTSRNVFDLRSESDDLGFAGLRGDFRVFNRWERTHFRDPEPQPISGETIDSDQNNLSTGGRGAVEAERSLGPSDHLATLALELRGDQLLDEEFDDPSRFVFGLSLHDEIALLDRRVLMVPGVRYDNTEGFDDRWLPSFGLTLAPWAWLRLKTNVEQSFRVPNFDELFLPDKGFIRGNPALRPEEALNFDVGFEFALAKLWIFEDLRAQFSWFRNDIDNMIVFQRINVNTIQPTNTGDAKIDGVELAFQMGVFGWLDASVNWTHLDARRPLSEGDSIIGLPGDEGPIPGRPDDEVSARLVLSPPFGWLKLVGELQYTSDIPVSFSGLAFVPARTVYGASASVDLAKLWGDRRSRRWPASLRVFWRGTNLTDQSVRDAVGFPQPGRAHLFGVEGQW